MVYDAENAEEVSGGTVPPDTVLNGIVINVNDGVVKDFVTNLEKWSGSPDQTAVNVTFSAKYDDEVVKVDRVFTYNVGEGGKTTFTKNSNLGKFHRKYGCLPKVNVEVKLISNNDGFLNVKLD